MRKFLVPTFVVPGGIIAGTSYIYAGSHSPDNIKKQSQIPKNDLLPEIMTIEKALENLKKVFEEIENIGKEHEQKTNIEALIEKELEEKTILILFSKDILKNENAKENLQKKQKEIKKEIEELRKKLGKEDKKIKNIYEKIEKFKDFLNNYYDQTFLTKKEQNIKSFSSNFKNWLPRIETKYASLKGGLSLVLLNLEKIKK